jgi:signal transduction histidine kinase
MLRLSRDLVIIDFNLPSGMQALEAPETMIGQSLPSTGLILVDLADAHAVVARVLDTGTAERFEILRPGPKGPRHFELRIGPAADDEVLIVARDITERKRVREERVKLEAKVQQTQKLETLGVLAGGIAHDFNNLLVAILGNSQLVLEQLPEVSPVRENLEDLEQAAFRAKGIANQLLAYSGRGTFEKENFDLSELVEEMVQLLRVSVSKKAVVKCEFARNLPSVEGDPSQICQVVMNLIINASDALGDGPGEITLKTGITASRRDPDGETTAGDYVFLEISDTGCGMDVETQEKIFDPFFTTHGLGRGLGLAALQGIVRGHQGFVELESALGEGTTVRVGFPASSTHVQTVKKERPRSAAWLGSGTILVVDDEASLRRLAERVLVRCGFEVLTARDGVEAVEVFRDNTESISAVLLDLTMPRMGGAEALEEILRISPEARVILTSGFGHEGVAARFPGRRVTFLHKPFGTDGLTEKVRKVLEE